MSSRDTVNEMKSLVESGDIKLDEYKTAFRAKYGIDYAGTDDRICECIAYMEAEDPDMDAAVAAMHDGRTFD